MLQASSLAQSQDRAEVIRAVAHVDDAVKIFPVALEKGFELHAFAHVGLASNLARVLRARWVNSPTKVQQARLLPFRRVRDNLHEKVTKAFILRVQVSSIREPCSGTLTCKMVSM